MEQILQSYTIVPSTLYVERDADRQIRTVIQNMTRPGYILVARQMGKTNLLLHTKDVLENKRNVFTYIDFTSIFCETEAECYDEIIDITLDTHKNIFQKEAEIIEQRRNSRPLTTQREFTRDLRLLIGAVDKLVIILDEIDALTRMPFSDNVFSLIRSHYFQRKNYPDLSKLSYLLSGVMEPKDIIKNPDISPFNIGQEIYVKDFTRQEFDSFLIKAGLAGKYDRDFYDRIFYWTCGHPRLTWDLCQIIEERGVHTVDGINDLVNEYYLTTCDKAPIDGIRKQVANDSELRDVVLQLIYGMTDSLKADQRKKLYLGGIINFDVDTVKFKNPILEKSLPIDWVKNQGNKEIDTQEALDRAERLIFINKDYKTAQLVLETLYRTSERNDKTDKILLLLGESLYRQYQNKKAISFFEKIKVESSSYSEAHLKIALSLFASESFKDALKTYEECLALKGDKAYVARVKLGIAETISEMRDTTLYPEAERMLYEMLNNITDNADEYHMYALILYYNGLIFKNKGDNVSAVRSFDSAISYAQSDEQIILHYYKYKCTESSEKKEEIIDELINLMLNASEKPVLDDFDNALAFSKYYALLVFAEVILYHPHFLNKIEPMFKWFYEKREDVYTTICATLAKNEHPDTEKFARWIIQQTKDGKIEPTELSMVDVMAVWAQQARDADLLNNLGRYCYDYLSTMQSKITLPEVLVRVVLFPLQKDIKERDFYRVKKVLANSKKWFVKTPGIPLFEEHYIMMSFYSAVIAFMERNYKWLLEDGSKFLRQTESFISKVDNEAALDVSMGMLRASCNTVFDMGIKINEELSILRGEEIPFESYGRNTRVTVYDHIHNQEVTVKLKNAKREVLSGFYEIKRVEP